MGRGALVLVVGPSGAGKDTIIGEAQRRIAADERFFFPRRGQHLKSMADEWLCFGDGARFTNESLGYVVDMWPQVVESYRHGDDPYDVRDEKVDKARAVIEKPFWYPTLLLNLDVKKALPDEGVEWLFARVRAKQIKNGRLDLEVVVLDEEGDVVALSHHISLVLGAERNMAQRRKTEGEASKL